MRRYREGNRTLCLAQVLADAVPVDMIAAGLEMKRQQGDDGHSHGSVGGNCLAGGSNQPGAAQGRLQRI